MIYSTTTWVTQRVFLKTRSLISILSDFTHCTPPATMLILINFVPSHFKWALICLKKLAIVTSILSLSILWMASSLCKNFCKNRLFAGISAVQCSFIWLTQKQLKFLTVRKKVGQRFLCCQKSSTSKFKEKSNQTHSGYLASWVIDLFSYNQKIRKLEQKRVSGLLI